MAKTFDLEIVAIIEDELLDLDWTSHVTVTLSYQTRVIGEQTLRDTVLFPDSEKRVVIKLHGFNISNMVGFKGFIQRLLPNDIDTELDDMNANQLAIADSNVDEGHDLSPGINLSVLSKASVIESFVHAYDVTEIGWGFIFYSSDQAEFDFGSCEFVLKKGETRLALLYGSLRIMPGKTHVLLRGHSVAALTEFLGMATLKGVRTVENNNTWLAHAIRSFEIQVDMIRTENLVLV
ncbi:hypothetical protein CCMA1212_002988 [Trichoderma ghanense]|uniref:Uncharacterized protein n=1 Tax=Trichoderma ghanense TaxID=65468 RepID=A0ABY2HA72_9HYPO